MSEAHIATTCGHARPGGARKTPSPFTLHPAAPMLTQALQSWNVAPSLQVSLRGGGTLPAPSTGIAGRAQGTLQCYSGWLGDILISFGISSEKLENDGMAAAAMQQYYGGHVQVAWLRVAEALLLAVMWFEVLLV